MLCLLGCEVYVKEKVKFVLHVIIKLFMFLFLFSVDERFGIVVYEVLVDKQVSINM